VTSSTWIIDDEVAANREADAFVLSLAWFVADNIGGLAVGG
jgi:hypothetical protein